MASVTATDVAQAREILLARVGPAKLALVQRIEGGDRDWGALREALWLYIDLQTAADVLSGQTPIVNSARR